MLLDTNILIYFLNSALPIHGHQWIDSAIKSGAHILVISRIELLGWSGHTEQSEQDARHFMIRNLDAIIAATALRLQVPLVTRNINDFKNISNLSLINPFELSS
jgi:toxin FitB